MPPLIYGTELAYVSAPEARGPAGDLDKCSPLAQFVGFYRGTSYLLLGRNWSIISRAPRNCVPLDELRRRDAGLGYSPWDVEEAVPASASGGSRAAGTSVFPDPTQSVRAHRTGRYARATLDAPRATACGARLLHARIAYL